MSVDETAVEKTVSEETLDRKVGLTFGVGESDHTVLKNATIENSSIGHIGDQIDVKDGGKVMTAEAVAAEAKLKQAKAEDMKEKVGNTLKDIFVPGHKLFGSIGKSLDKAAGCKTASSTSRYDAVLEEMCSKGNDAQLSEDAEMSR